MFFKKRKETKREKERRFKKFIIIIGIMGAVLGVEVFYEKFIPLINKMLKGEIFYRVGPHNFQFILSLIMVLFSLSLISLPLGFLKKVIYEEKNTINRYETIFIYLSFFLVLGVNFYYISNLILKALIGAFPALLFLGLSIYTYFLIPFYSIKSILKEEEEDTDKET